MLATSKVSEKYRDLNAFLARELKKARKAAKLTQKELAVRAGFNQSTVCHVEKGGASLNPGLFTLMALFEALGVDLLKVIGRARKSISKT